jgi:hypothetical protein
MGNRPPTDSDTTRSSSSIAPAQELPPLPWRVPLEPAPWWAMTLFVTPFVAVPALNAWLWMGARDFLAAVLLTLIGASVVRVSGGVVLYRVEITADALRARSRLLVRSVAWQDVDQLSADDDSVLVGTGDEHNEINGIIKGQARYVAEVMDAVRLRAEGNPVRRTGLRPGLGALLMLLYLVLSVGTFLVRWHLV